MSERTEQLLTGIYELLTSIDIKLEEFMAMKRPKPEPSGFVIASAPVRKERNSPMKFQLANQPENTTVLWQVVQPTLLQMWRGDIYSVVLPDGEWTVQAIVEDDRGRAIGSARLDFTVHPGEITSES